jgi:hypothetical protein
MTEEGEREETRGDGQDCQKAKQELANKNKATLDLDASRKQLQMETIKATVNKTHPKASDGCVFLSLSEIREDEQFKCIQFDDVIFDDCEAEQVIDFFANDSRTWKEIHFCNCSGPVNAIVTIVLELDIVESLALSNRDPEEEMSPLLAVGLMLPINTSLTSLAISKTCRTEMGLAEAKCLAFGLRRNTTLKNVSLCDEELNDETTLMALAKGFETNQALESVTLNLLREPDPTCLIQALAENPSLKNFSINGQLYSVLA